MIAMGYVLDGRGSNPGSGKGLFPYAQRSDRFSHSVQWVPETISLQG
jgi:hypothetical protein